MVKATRLIFILLVIIFQPGHTQKKELVVGGDFDYAPFTFIDETGKPGGLEIDVLEAIFEGSGIRLNYQLTVWDSALSYFHAGKTDILAGIIFSEERSRSFDFSIPLHTEYYSVFIRKGLPFVDLSSLYDYKPVVLEQDISIDKFLVPMGLFGNHMLAKSLPEALSIIELGLADYVLAPNLLGLNEIEENNYENIEIAGPSIIPSIYCLAVRKGETKLLNMLNEGITELRRSGKLIEIQEKWKVPEEEESKDKRIARTVGAVFIIALFVLVLVILWVRLLRQQIKKATESLHMKNQELQKSEEKFRAITENSSDIIWHLDSNFILTYISPADERIRGFKKEEVLGKSLFTILKPEGIEMIKQGNSKRMADLEKGIKAPPVTYELEELCKDGSYIWVEATATATYDNGGNITGYHGVSRNISERKKAEQLLRERESQLTALNSTKDKLFSIIAHDLKSPFNAILGLSELLMKKTKKPEAAKTELYMEMIHSSARNTLVLLDNLLTWVSTQTGKNIYNPETIILPALISEISESAESIAKMKNITIRTIETDVVEIHADANMLKTILRNLVSNAIKYTYPDGEITISAVQQQNNIEIAVSDNGVGMDEATRDSLFDINTNTTTTGTADEKGSGLGLILCKDFVGRHGGALRVESEPGKGSTFTFTLPVSRSA
jgi:PAS domain S-box-containing protein